MLEVIPGSIAAKKVSLMEADGYKFKQSVREAVHNITERYDVIDRIYSVRVTVPNGFFKERVCGLSETYIRKQSMTAELIGDAWNYYSKDKKLKKFEEFLSDIGDNQEFLRDIHESEHYTSSLPRLSRIVNRATHLLKFRVKVK